eukprot:m.85884 g.85884  ORF g.85884 m.85884 type:complete len:218 (+) comp14855_c0_seq2:309-962(+)
MMSTEWPPIPDDPAEMRDMIVSLRKQLDDARQQASEMAAAAAAAEVAGRVSVSASPGTKRPRTEEGTAAAPGTLQPNEDGDQFLDLEGNKRATLSHFKGKPWVDLREYYKAGDTFKPGSKGIMLNVGQFEKLRQGIADIQNWLTANDTSKFVDLGNNRRAAVSEFKNSTFINIREFYEKSGKLLPGKKGVTLKPKQWNAFVAIVPEFAKLLDAEGAK